MDYPVLYSFKRCPYAIRTRISLILSKTKCELREVLLKDKPESMLNASPKGTVPVLIKNNGTVIDESIDIINWLISRNNFFGPNEYDNFIEEMIKLFDNEFKFHLDRYKYSTRYNKDEELFHRNKCAEILNNLEEKIISNPWLLGSTVSKLDVCILPFIRQFRIANEEWFDNNEKFKKINITLKYFLEWEVFQIAMKKYPQWKEGDKKTIFPS